MIKFVPFYNKECDREDFVHEFPSEQPRQFLLKFKINKSPKKLFILYQYTMETKKTYFRLIRKISGNSKTIFYVSIVFKNYFQFY